MTLSKKIGIAALTVGSFALSYWLRSPLPSSHIGEETAASERIITMAPSSGEVVFSLGLGDQVVGVSRFATFPPEVNEIPKIGGYLDVDMEAIVRLKPTTVVLLKEQADLARQIERLGMNTLLVDHMSVDGIRNSIKIIGENFGKLGEAAELDRDLTERIGSVRNTAHQKSGTRLLLSIGREVGLGKISGLVAAGAGGYHQELLEIAGYTNAYTGEENFPQLSRENLIRSNPDVIVDMVNTKEAEAEGIEKIMADWRTLSELSAVKQGRVYLLVGDQHFVPGTRFIETLEWLASCEERSANE